jgi:hypothetical protein
LDKYRPEEGAAPQSGLSPRPSGAGGAVPVGLITPTEMRSNQPKTCSMLDTVLIALNIATLNAG